MIAIRYPLVVRRPGREHLTLEAAAARVGLHPVLVERFVEFGLVEPAERTGAELRLDAACLPRLVAISRLRADLGVNLAGVQVILDMRARIEELQRGLDDVVHFVQTELREELDRYLRREAKALVPKHLAPPPRPRDD